MAEKKIDARVKKSAKSKSKRKPKGDDSPVSLSRLRANPRRGGRGR